MPRVLITGIAGQDGYYLALFLHKLGYEIHGTVRNLNCINSSDVVVRDTYRELNAISTLHEVPLENTESLGDVLKLINPDEVYHLAGPTIVVSHLEDKQAIFSLIVSSTKKLLDTLLKTNPNARLFFAGSSEIFGTVSEYPQSLSSEYNPRSIYGVAKLTAYQSILYYRERHNLFACTGILYNHESPRRSINFISRKVTMAVARISLGLQDKLFLGNMDAERDWGYAPEYVQAMWKMLNHEIPRDFIIATGTTRKLRELVEIAFSYVNLNYQNYVEFDPKYYRPKEIVPLCGDPVEIKSTLNWCSNMKFEKMIEEMVHNDIHLLKDHLRH